MPKSINVTPRPSVTVDVTTGPPGPQGPPGPPGPPGTGGGGGGGVVGSIRLKMTDDEQLLLTSPPGHVPADGPVLNFDTTWVSLTQNSISGDGFSFNPDAGGFSELTYTADGLYMYSLYYEVVQRPAGNVNPPVMMSFTLLDSQWLSLHEDTATQAVSNMVSWFGEQSAGDTNSWQFSAVLGHEEVNLSTFNLSIVRLG